MALLALPDHAEKRVPKLPGMTGGCGMGRLGPTVFWCWHKMRPSAAASIAARRDLHLLTAAGAFGAAVLLAGCQSGSDTGSQPSAPPTAVPSSPVRSLPSAPPPLRASPVLVDTDSLSVTMPSGWQLLEKKSNLITLSTERGASRSVPRGWTNRKRPESSSSRTSPMPASLTGTPVSARDLRRSQSRIGPPTGRWR